MKLLGRLNGGEPSCRLVLIEDDHLSFTRKVFRIAPRSNDPFRLTVQKHIFNTVIRVFGVDGQISASCLQNTQHADHRIRRTLPN
ncbi:hypothetical protein D3C77_210910 [compost metagenome]